MMCRRQGLVDTGSMPNWHVHTDSSTCIYSCIKLTTSIQLITSKQKSLPITSPTTTYHYPKSVGITYNTTDTEKKMALTYVDTHFFSRFSPFSSRLRKSFPPPYIPPSPPPPPKKLPPTGLQLASQKKTYFLRKSSRLPGSTTTSPELVSPGDPTYLSLIPSRLTSKLMTSRRLIRLVSHFMAYTK